MTLDQDVRVRLRLMRHGQVANHRGDVSLTDLGAAQADAAGRQFAEENIEVACLLSGETQRTRDTASGFAAGYRAARGRIPDPIVSFAIRNPDLYLGGHRINMAEGAAALVAQSPAVSEDDVEASPFFHGFLRADDRVGFWLEHGNPPGENARDVGVRIDKFARSLADVPDWAGRTVVAVTHSPVLRAVRYHHCGDYSREPAFLHGYDLTLTVDGRLTFMPFVADTGDIPATSQLGRDVVQGESEHTTKRTT